jgi:uncharacterized protein (TIGR00730 family)
MLKRIKTTLVFAWQMLGVNRRLLYGMWKLTRLPQPAVTFFGGAKITAPSNEVENATILAQMLANRGFSIITGGGPGIMEAANRGAFNQMTQCRKENNCKVTFNSFGIGLTRLNDETINPHVQDFIMMEHFFERKWLLVRYSVAFVVFPGGFGTMDELFEILVLIQCNRMPNTPIVLIGKEFWGPMIDWIVNSMIVKKLLHPENLELFTLTDDLEEAFHLIEKTSIKKDEATFTS